MATTTVSIGSNQSIDTETPATSSGSGPSYTVTFGTTPTGIHVGDIGFMDTEDAGGGNPSDYTFLVTGISGDDITLKYLTDTASKGDASPVGLYDGTGTSGAPNQAVMVFKRAFSTITLFEAMVDDASPDYWGTTDDVVGELHADSNFTDATVNFDNKQSLSSVTLSVYEYDRHDGTAESGALWKPTSGSGHDQGILRINIDNMTVEWIDISFDSLDSTNSNKAIVLAGTNDNNIIRNNLIHDKDGNPGGNGAFMIHTINAGISTDTLTIQNNIIYNIVETNNDNSMAINTNQWAGTANIYNNTIYNVDAQGTSKITWGIVYGNAASAVVNIKNNIVSKMVADGAGTNERAYQKFNASSTENASNNLSDDTTTTAAYKAPGTDSLQDKTLAEIDFVSITGGSEDLHIGEDSVCIGAGVDLGATNEVNIDIDGETMSGNWSIGADWVSAVTGNPAFLMFVD